MTIKGDDAFMKHAGKLSVGIDILAARLLGRKRPVSVGWAVTKRCNARCAYCGKWNDSDDISTEEALALCDQFVSVGARFVSLTGGEPLLRDDLGTLIRRLKDGGVYVSLSSNGALVPRKLDVVRSADRLNISLDGSREAHDSFRGQGSFDLAVAGILAAQSAGVPVTIAAVLHARNAEDIPSLLGLAQELGCRINIQPLVTNGFLPADHAAVPTPEAVRRAVGQLIAEKRCGRNRLIENSLPSLRHMLEWPDGASVACESRIIACRVEPDGHVHNCGNSLNQLPETDYRLRGFAQAFSALPLLVCAGCWCSNRYEANMLASLNPRILLHTLRRF